MVILNLIALISCSVTLGLHLAVGNYGIATGLGVLAALNLIFVCDKLVL